jgi:signal transduction histidine kinase
LRERIELMGGRLKVESRPGATSLIAELTEL